MRKALSLGAAALIATLTAATPAMASQAQPQARPQAWVWHLYEQHLTLSECEFNGNYLVGQGNWISAWCDFHDAGANDGLWALWLATSS